MNSPAGSQLRRTKRIALVVAGLVIAALTIAAVVVVMGNTQTSARVTNLLHATPNHTDSSGPVSPEPTPTRAKVVTATRKSQELVSLLAPHKARKRPVQASAAIQSLPARTPITEERTVLPVLVQEGKWLKVRLPGRPNSHTGWIRKRGTRLSLTGWHIVLDLSRRRVTALRDGQAVRAFKVVIGKPSTPTPRGEFFVEESLALRTTDMGGPYALALSARSTVYQEFAGGPGQIAFHGLTNIGGVPGTAVSHGCVRLTTEAISWLAFHIAPGVPVTITR